jgi:hypothetical protein
MSCMKCQSSVISVSSFSDSQNVVQFKRPKQSYNLLFSSKLAFMQNFCLFASVLINVANVEEMSTKDVSSFYHSSRLRWGKTLIPLNYLNSHPCNQFVCYKTDKYFPVTASRKLHYDLSIDLVAVNQHKCHINSRSFCF